MTSNPTASSTASPVMTGPTFFAGAQPELIDWAACLQPAPISPSRLESTKAWVPAWHRVPKTPTPLAGRRTLTIWKKIPHPYDPQQRYRRQVAPRFIDNQFFNREHEISKRKRTRVQEETIEDVPTWASQHPAAETERELSQAKYDAIHQIAQDPDSTFAVDNRNLHLGGLALVARPKRRLDSIHAPISNTSFYRELLTYVVAVWERYGLDIPETPLVEHMLRLEGSRRDPRQCLAAVGAPDLTTITDVTEPDTTIAAVQPSEAPAAAGVKGSAEEDSHSEPAPGSSPTKDAISSVTSTHQDGNVAGEEKAWHVEAPDWSTSNEGETAGQEDESFISAETFSPIKRPGAPTPSRWARYGQDATPAEPTTPRPQTPDQTGRLSLMAAVPESASPAQATPSFWNKATDGFQFSDDLNDDRRASGQTLVFGSKSGRRKSEPLFQHLIKGKAGRYSMSPQKFYTGVEGLEDNSTQGPATPVRQKDVASNIGSTEVTNGPELYTPMPSYFKHPRLRTPSASPAKRTGVYNIDMRQNPDIFGAQSSKSAAQGSAVQQLAHIADHACAGHAKVVVMEENGKLIVRFKLPTKYAELFPDSQGADESRFTVTPSVISSSPRINFKGHQMDVKVAAEEQSETDYNSVVETMPLDESTHTADVTPRANTSRNVESNSPGDLSQTPQVSSTANENMSVASAGKDETFNTAPTHTSPAGLVGFAIPDSFRTHGSSFLTATQSPRDQQASAVFPRDEDRTLVVSDFDTFTSTPRTASRSPSKKAPVRTTLDDFSIPETPQQQQSTEQEAPSSSLISDVDFEPTFQTPTHGHLDISPTVNGSTAPKATTPTPRKTQVSPVKHDTVAAKTPTPSKQATASTPKAAPPSSPPLATSFTPVNKPADQGKVATPTSAKGSAVKDAETVQPESERAAVDNITYRSAKNYYDDSPNRDFMRAFIQRSKPKKLSTTETGSPVPNGETRQPLGAKSPNTGTNSPRKGKRKLDADAQELGSPLKKNEDSAARKRQRAAVKKEDQIYEVTEDAPDAGKSAKSDAAQASAHDPNNSEPPRRSTRLKSAPTEKEGAALKSSIPTPIKLNRAGAGRGNGQVLNSSVRSEQAELTRQTSNNTKKNRGKTGTVQEVLARCSEELSGEDSDELNGEPKEPKVTKRGKTVSWKDPIESFQETPKPKRGRPAGTTAPGVNTTVKTGPKPKATQGKTGVATPKAAGSKSGISQAAKNLGMASNGTPAKRVTRAQTRKLA